MFGSQNFLSKCYWESIFEMESSSKAVKGEFSYDSIQKLCISVDFEIET